MVPEQLTRGEALAFDLFAAADSGSVPPDWATTPVTVVLGRGAARHTFRWRPGGTSDPQFSHDPDPSGPRLLFDLTSAWTGANLTAGRWTLSVLVGPSATTQDEIGAITLTVVERPGGTLPTTG